MNLLKKKTSPTTPLTQQMLTDITRGLQYAASTTTQTVVQQHLALLERFFTRDEEGILHAEMVSMRMGDEHCIEVPLISLAHTQGLALAEMKVKLAVKLKQQEAKELKTNLDKELSQTRSAFSVSMESGNKIGKRQKSPQFMDIELTFKSSEIPEGLSRIVEEYSQLIHPIKDEKK